MLFLAASLPSAARTEIPRQPRRAPLREKTPTLFDLLFDESDAWETLPEEHQTVAIQTLARLIAQAALRNPEREKNHE
jgi:hypothetical protein